jgi:hypothetical protein
MASPCTPRARYAEREAAKQTAREEAAAIRAQLLADAERESLENPDRPAVLHPETWPEEITVRIVHYTLPGTIIAEAGPDEADQTSWTLNSDAPETAMAGAEVALAALGYTLDRFRMYQDMSFTVGRFYRKAGPYA